MVNVGAYRRDAVGGSNDADVFDRVVGLGRKPTGQFFLFRSLVPEIP